MIVKVLSVLFIAVAVVQCIQSEVDVQLKLKALPLFAEYQRLARHIRQKKHFDWQIADPTEPLESTTRHAYKTSTLPPSEVVTVNVTSMLIRDGTVQINPDEIMHKEEAEGIGDVGLILWGGSHAVDVKKMKVSVTVAREMTKKTSTVDRSVIDLEAETATEESQTTSTEVPEEILQSTYTSEEITTESFLQSDIIAIEQSDKTSSSSQKSEKDPPNGIEAEKLKLLNSKTSKTINIELSPAPMPTFTNSSSLHSTETSADHSTSRPLIVNNVIAILSEMISTPEDIKILEEIGNVEPVITESPAIMIIPTEPTSTESNIEKIMDTMPTANEDVIRVVKLKQDQRYGKGMAKPKYISMALANMNSTEYDDDEEVITTTQKSVAITNSTSMTMETRSEYSVSIVA